MAEIEIERGLKSHMKLLLTTLVAGILIYGTEASWCQEAKNDLLPTRPLSIAETHEIPGVFTNPIFPAKCGFDGSTVYVRLLNSSANMPATRINADKQGVRSFGLEGTHYQNHAHIWDFAPAPDGGAYLLVWYHLQESGKSRTGYSLLSFNSDGKLTRDAPIEGVPFDPLQIAAFGNGTLVVAGRKASERGGHKGTPGIAIITESGRFVKALQIEHDVPPPKTDNKKRSRKSKTSDSDQEQSEAEKEQEQYDLSLDLSIAQLADDGNIYVMRRTAGGPLFQISPSGVVHEIKLPDYQSGTVNAAMVAHGHVLIHYVKDEEGTESDLGLYSEYDLATMEKIRNYDVDLITPIANAMQACYNADQIIFLKIRNKGRLLVLVAKLQ